MENKWEFNNRYEVTFEVKSGFIFKREFVFPNTVSEPEIITMMQQTISGFKRIKKIIRKNSCIRIF